MRSTDDITSRLDHECEWLVSNNVLPADPVMRDRRMADAVSRPCTPVFAHGDLQVSHVFVDGDDLTGCSTRSEAGPG